CPRRTGRPVTSTTSPVAAATPRPVSWRCACPRSTGTPRAAGSSTRRASAPSGWRTSNRTRSSGTSPSWPMASPTVPAAAATTSRTAPSTPGSRRGRPGRVVRGGWTPFAGCCGPAPARTADLGRRGAGAGLEATHTCLGYVDEMSESSPYADDLRLAHVLADQVERITLSRFQADDLVVETKPDLTPVSDADRACEEVIRSQLGRSRGRDAIVGEEYGTTGSSTRRWIIDPIDGTKNYVRGVPVWATLIG